MQRLTFRTEDGVTLEGEIRQPDGAAVGSAVLCHPHPRFGGSKDHPLLWAIRIELAQRSFAVLSFNFRGVMGSEGDYGGGVKEVDDVRAAIGWVREAVAGPTVLCGWSFGAHVALREAPDDDRVAALSLVGLPLEGSDPDLPSIPDRARLGAFDRPVLLLAGGQDVFCPGAELEALGSALPSAAVEIVPGADHYFAKREREAGRIVAAFAERAVAGTG